MTNIENNELRKKHFRSKIGTLKSSLRYYHEKACLLDGLPLDTPISMIDTSNPYRKQYKATEKALRAQLRAFEGRFTV